MDDIDPEDINGLSPEDELYGSSVYEDGDLFDPITDIFALENHVHIDFFNVDEYGNWYIGMGKIHPWDLTPEERNLTVDEFDDMVKEFFNILLDEEYEVHDYTVEYYG